MPSREARSGACWAALALVAIFVALPLGVSQARTWRVAKDGSGDFAVIQPAVDAASPGDTIRIGAGRYTETQVTTAFGALPRVACVVVNVDSLTFIGDDPDSVVIGPNTYTYWNYGPVGIGATETLGLLRVERISLVNNYEPVRKVYGHFEVRECKITGEGLGVDALSTSGGQMIGCTFEGCLCGSHVYGGSDIEVRECHFIGCGVPGGAAAIASYATDVSYYDCDFEAGGAGVAFDWSSGHVYRCHFEQTGDFAISVFGSGTNVTAEDCVARDGMGGLYVDAQALFTGSRDIFHGTRATLGLAQSHVILRDCHILNGGGWSVQLLDDWNYQVGTYELQSNWWGVADSTQIAAWIYDKHDNQTVGGEVIFSPFLSQPVGVQSKSLGGLKALFR